jgi:hypothetical protein
MTSNGFDKCNYRKHFWSAVIVGGWRRWRWRRRRRGVMFCIIEKAEGKVGSMPGTTLVRFSVFADGFPSRARL